MADHPTTLIVTDNHTSGPFNIPWTSSRATFYGITGVPTVEFDGLNPAIGASTCNGAYQDYVGHYNQRMVQTQGLAPVAIQGRYTFDANVITLRATFTKDTATSLVNTRAFLLIAESGLLYGGTTYNHITRAAYEEGVTLTNVGDYVVVEHVFTRNPSWNMDHIECTAFIQNMTSREVYQAGRLPNIIDFEASFSPAVESVPNGNGTAEFSGTCTNISDVADNLTFELSNATDWSAEFMVEGDAGYHTGPVTYPVGPGESKQIWMRVMTDADVMIGTVAINVTSSVTDRMQPVPARVFNGSPAVLLVDDDTNRTDEVIVQNALGASNLLFDTWDCYNGHAGLGPRLDEMQGYDILLWHNGWATLDLLTAEDQTAVKAFMDAGGGFILSSQSFLETPTIDTEFVTDYLGVSTWVSSVETTRGIGIAGDPISDGMNFGPLTYPQFWWDRSDDLTPSAAGVVCLNNDIGSRIGMRTQGRAGKSVFFAFAINGMSEAPPDPNNPKTLIARSVEYVQPQEGQGVDDEPVAGLPSSIRAIEPNPLTAGQSAAVLRLRISDAAARHDGRVDVIDANGRLIRNLINGQMPVGVSTVAWDGRDARGKLVGAGVYYVHMTTIDGSDGARLVVIH